MRTKAKCFRHKNRRPFPYTRLPRKQRTRFHQTTREEDQESTNSSPLNCVFAKHVHIPRGPKQRFKRQIKSTLPSRSSKIKIKEPVDIKAKNCVETRPRWGHPRRLPNNSTLFFHSQEALKVGNRTHPSTLALTEKKHELQQKKRRKSLGLKRSLPFHGGAYKHFVPKFAERLKRSNTT